jgi:digeranylgeranylglycerophospholipid reductase
VCWGTALGANEKYDVIIVGLGPAGATLSYFLRNSGLKVLGIDMVSWSNVWGKPCGDAIGAHHFQETGIPEPKGKELYQNVDGVIIYSPSEESEIVVKGKGYMINRTEVGKRILRDAEKGGVEIRLKSQALGPYMEEGKLKGVIVKDLLKNKKYVVEGKIIVDATGNSGVLRRRLPKEWPVNEKIEPVDYNIAYREVVELDYDIERPNYIRIYINKDIAPGGYWWFFPEGKNVANVGLGVQGGRGYELPNKIFKEKLLKRLEFFKIKRVLKAGGSFVPTRRPANTLVWDNFVGIGDNSFTVNPVHGGGMGYAFYASYLASKTIIDAFEKGDFTARGLWSLNIKYMRTLGAKQASLDIFRMFLQELSNDEIEFGIKNKIMGAEEAYETSISGDLKANLSLLEKLSILVKGMKRPMLLFKLAKVAEYMKLAKRHYLRYPEDPKGLKKWISELIEIYKSFKKDIGITF